MSQSSFTGASLSKPHTYEVNDGFVCLYIYICIVRHAIDRARRAAQSKEERASVLLSMHTHRRDRVTSETA